MKLLIVTQKVDSGDQLLGFFIDWIKRFADKFDLVTVICLQKGDFDLPDNVRVKSLGKDRGQGKARQLFNFYYLISTLDYDAVLVHMNPIWMVLGGPVWRLMGKHIFLWYTHKAVTWKLRIAEIFTQKIFTASKESFRLPSRKVIVTGHGINTELFKPAGHHGSGHKLRILSVGRISPVKNYETLIEAAKILKDGGMDFSVTMAGEPALAKDKDYLLKLKYAVNILGLGDEFNFVGKVDFKNLPELYQSHDLFVHLSKTGSVDKTLLEAMACGMKVLSSNDSARAFLPGRYLFDENDPKELAEKIKEASKIPVDPSLREYIVVHHNLDRLIGKLSDIIYG